MLNELMTTAGENLRGVAWTKYPRPQMRRESYLNLNGEWDFAVNYENLGQIRVPFCPESKLSCIGRHFDEGSLLCYSRNFRLPEGFKKGRMILHIGAADQRADVYVNGKRAGSHEGGYEAFSFDITDLLQDENKLQICCFDDLTDQTYPYGKQVLPAKRGGMWYTPVSGIWQTVWLESVPETYIQKLHIENRGYSVKISIEPALTGTVTVAQLGSFPLEAGSVTITPENPCLWSPENPYLYDFTVEAGEDCIQSYFAIRSLEIKMVGSYPRLCLNGKPYFFHGLLDQGYWPDGLFTPAAPECYADDIRMMKKLGFNTLRKHIKVEAEEFYYQCDKLGMIVWQDMVNNDDYNFLRDTALPTIGSDNVYEQFKLLDDTRFIDSTSGWFRREKTDVDSRHVYFRKVKLQGDGVKPLVLSEFGGKTYKAEGHVFNPDKSYGYGGCTSLKALNEAVVKLYMDEILTCVRNGLCAAIYTQVSDVEDEINGLVTYDRKVEKMEPAPMQAVAAALQQAIE